MSIINRLDRSVYNRIAAGEVVENPASAVKELVENAIDASATEITVRIENGGIKFISVSDNGCGIAEDDLENAVYPHATSKIAVAEDLETVSTLGFRGEALASIAAVSKLTIKSNYVHDDGAHFLAVEGGEIVEKGDCLLQAGTVVSVANLFYNTPPRFKFLKTPKGEESTVTGLIKELILANPDVSFRYYADGKQLFFSEGEGLENAVCTVFGSEITQTMIPFLIKEKGYRVQGYTARPASAGIRGNKNNQIFIVNGRVITETSLQSVVANAYGESLMKRSFPSVVVDMVVPFDEVDVNVHPNKREVRFANTKLLYGLVYSAIKKALADDEEFRQKELIAKMNGEPRPVMPQVIPKPVYMEPIVEEEEEEEPQRTEAEIMQEKIDRRVEENSKKYSKDSQMQYTTKMDLSKLIADDEDKETDEDFYCPPVLTFKDDTTRTEYGAQQGKSGYSLPQIQSMLQKQAEPEKKIIGQLFDTYLLVEVGDVVYLIDQHAAHERMLYNALEKSVRNRVEIQELMLPREIRVEEEQVVFFTAHKEDFSKLGFLIETEKDGLVRVLSVPCTLVGMNIETFIRSVNCEKASFEKLTDAEYFRDKLAQTACKHAIKGGDRMTDGQIKEFLDEYIKQDAPTQCPHGRPTVIPVNRKEIEKMFGRIV